MKIILRKDFEQIGSEGEIKEVKDGYARNFLIPKGIAVAATVSNIKTYEEIKRQQKRKFLKELDDAKKLSELLGKENIIIEVKTGEDDKAYGSVTSQMIFDELMKKGYGHIERKKIVLKEHIKTIGEHDVQVKLHSNVIANLRVTVVKENAGIEEAKSETAPENQN
jgi:large subunit ribosomal protein L9